MASIVADEMRRARSGEAEARPSAWSETDDANLQVMLGRDEYLVLMAEAEEALMREIELEEAMMAPNGEHEYEEYLAAEEAMLAAAEGDASQPSDADVLCPVCVRAPLLLTAEGCVACSAASDSCTLRLDARGHPAPLEHLRARMETLIRDHSRSCSGAHTCRLPTNATEAALGMLLFSCSTCGVVTGVV